MPVRRTWLMRLSLADAAPAVPAWPAGIAVRTFERSRDERAVYDAVVEGFADHWGDEKSTFESFVHGSIDAAGERYDPRLWFSPWRATRSRAWRSASRTTSPTRRAPTSTPWPCVRPSDVAASPEGMTALPREAFWERPL